MFYPQTLPQYLALTGQSHSPGGVVLKHLSMLKNQVRSQLEEIIRIKWAAKQWTIFTRELGQNPL